MSYGCRITGSSGMAAPSVEPRNFYIQPTQKTTKPTQSGKTKGNGNGEIGQKDGTGHPKIYVRG